MLIAALLAIAAVSGCGSLYEREYYRDSDIVFGTDLTLDVYLMGWRSPQAFTAMSGALKEMNAQISLTDPDSALSQFNAAASGETVEVGKHAYALLALSERFYNETNGAFNVAVPELSELWHVDAGSSRYFGAGAEIDFGLPDYQTVTAARDMLAGFASGDAPFGVSGIQEEEKYYFKKLADGVRIDFGAVAKGYAADLCVQIASEYGLTSAVIDIAGNIKVYGRYYQNGAETDFPIPVTDPRSHGQRGFLFGEDLFILNLAGGDQSLVVSGDYQRYYDYPADADGSQGEIPVCHIIDPRTGMPLGIGYDGTRYVYGADTAVISAVICTQSAATADAYATAVCVMGYEAGKDFLKSKGVAGAVLTGTKLALAGITESDFFDSGTAVTMSRYITEYV